MSRQMTLWDIDSAISLPGLQDGPTHSDSPGGLTTAQCGQEAALANLSALPEKAKAHKTLGTSGPDGSVSSQSAALQLSLVNKLKQRFGTGGLILFKETWKESVTPSRLPVSLLRASGRRTSDSGCGSWATPATRDYKGANLKTYAERGGGTKGGQLCNQVVHLAGWPTPRQADGEKNVRTAEGSLSEMARKGTVQDLAAAAAITGWPTPQTSDHTGGGLATRAMGEGRHGSNLNDFAMLGAWPTPKAHDGEFGTPMTTERPMEKSTHLATIAKITASPQPARLTASGVLLTGSSAGMESGGQLAPSHSRWLMGLPPAWDECAPDAPRKLRKK